jgi:hypothetical protein
VLDLLGVTVELRVEDCDGESDADTQRVEVVQVVPLIDPLPEVDAHTEEETVTVSKGLSLTNPEGVYEEEALRETVGDTLPDLVPEGEVEAVREEDEDLVTEGEVEVVREEDEDLEVETLVVITGVTDGLPLILACDAVPEKVNSVDGVHADDKLANPDFVAMVKDGKPLAVELDDTLELPEELATTEGVTDKVYVTEVVGEATPDVDSLGVREMEEVVDRVPQADTEIERVPDPHVLALAVEVVTGLPDLLTLGEVEAENETVCVAVPALDLETRALGERLEEVE